MAETIMDRLDAAVRGLPDGAKCSLFCGPAVYAALTAVPPDDNARPSRHAEVNVVFTMTAGAWRLEHEGEPVADGTLDELVANG